VAEYNDPFLVVSWTEFCDLPAIKHVLVQLGLARSVSEAQRLVAQRAVKLGSAASMAGERVELDPDNSMQIVDIEPSPLADPSQYESSEEFEAITAISPHFRCPFALRVRVGKRHRRAILLTGGYEPGGEHG
jgi:hypothetical protein